jgi:hypothetical protein
LSLLPRLRGALPSIGVVFVAVLVLSTCTTSGQLEASISPSSSAAPVTASSAAATSLPRATVAVTAQPGTQPSGYQLAAECGYVGGPRSHGGATFWLVKCPSGLLSTALTPSLTVQGWENCGAAAGTTYWRNADLLILVTNFVNRADASGELGQKHRIAACGP